MRLTGVLLLAGLILSGNFVASTTFADSATAVVTERTFVPGPYGQIHLRISRPTSAAIDRVPLILFHPTPASGQYFAEFVKRMATDRLVIAMDTPGYGDSSRPAEPPPISGYADAAAAALRALGYGRGEAGQVDALGYHTGALIAVELAAAHPDLVRRLVLPGVPFYTGEERKKAYADNVQPDPEEKGDGSHLSDAWKHATIAVDAGVSLAQAQALFAEALQSHPHSYWGYHGVFIYDSETRFAAVSQPVLLMSTAGSLRAETEAAKPFFKNARYVHLADYTHGVFFVGADALATQAKLFLDEGE